MTLAFEDGARHLAIHFAEKRKVSPLKGENGRIAAQLKVVYLDDFAGRQKGAKLLIEGIGIGRTLPVEKARSGKENREYKENRD
jgi:hypothetical protein